MKKLLLSLIVAATAAVNVQAQSCTPGAQYADSTYGVWPDTVQNLPPATQNVAYSTDLNFKVPAEVTPSLDPSGTFVGSQIQSFKVTSVDGLPTGYNYACNVSSCQYAGGDNGCANVYGTTNDPAGTYPVTINVDATVLVQISPIGPPTQVTQSTSFDGYKIVLGAAGTIEQVIAPISVSPNPANDVININNISASMKASKIYITNIEGKVVSSKNVENNANYSFDLSNLKAGVYFVNVAHASGIETVKFVKQ